MPIMNGIDATKEIRKYFATKVEAQRPVILGVTGHVLDSYKDEGRNAGMDDIIEKPLYAKAFKEMMKKYNIK